jgi:glutamate racemase
MDNRPVGMFDSGVGGLSVLRHFQRLAPNERVVYFADTAWFPYGPRPAAEVRKRAFAITRRLLESDVKLIIVACNTASAAAIADLRQAFDVPFVGMVPGVKPAASRSRAGHVAILATPGTLDGGLYARVVEEFGRGTKISSVPGYGLAELVENEGAESPEARPRILELLGPPVAAGADTVVLGCTHYHFLAPVISAAFPALTIIDTSEAVARRALQVLDEGGMRAGEGGDGGIDLIVSGDHPAFRAAMARLGFEPAHAEATA